MTRKPHTARAMRDDLALDTLSRRVAEELALLSDLSRALQEALSHCRFAAPPDTETLARLQGIDRISQGVDDLRRLMEALPEHLPEAISVTPETLLARLKLRDLADRLASEDRPLSIAPRSQEGDVFWF